MGSYSVYNIDTYIHMVTFSVIYLIYIKGEIKFLYKP
jgi:hypothetical protein